MKIIERGRVRWLNYITAFMLFFPLIAFVAIMSTGRPFNFPAIVLSTYVLIAAALYLQHPVIRTNSNIILFGVVISLIYIYEFRGFAFLYFIAFTFIILHPRVDSIELYQKAKSVLEVLILLFFINHLLYIFGATSPLELDLSDRNVFLHGFMQHAAMEFEVTRPQSWRFYGFANEPGLLAAIIMLFLIFEKLNVKGNIILWTAGALTFSSGFILIMFVYFFLFKGFRISNYIYLVFGVLILWVVLPDSAIDFFKLMTLKVFTSEEQMMRLELYSFTQYWRTNPFILSLYLFAIVLTPKRFWIFFVLVGLYRHHFIFSAAVPLILTVSFAAYSCILIAKRSGCEPVRMKASVVNSLCRAN